MNELSKFDPSFAAAFGKSCNSFEKKTTTTYYSQLPRLGARSLTHSFYLEERARVESSRVVEWKFR